MPQQPSASQHPSATSEPASGQHYPAHWEADVVLRDGAVGRLRPIVPGDADRLVDFYARVSDRSKYLRFFSRYPTLSAADVTRFTEVDHRDRVAFVVTLVDDLVAVGRYERVDHETAEVAFLVEDAHQGRGLGLLLLEHLAQAARERGLRRFVAEVLPENVAMIGVFEDAGYRVCSGYEDGLLQLEFPVDATDTAVRVMRQREQRANARSIERILAPGAVAVVGVSREDDGEGGVGRRLVRHLVDGGFTGPVYSVGPGAPDVAGATTARALAEISGPVDLALVAVPQSAVSEVVVECAAKGVHGLVVVSGGYAETGEEGRARQRHLAGLARSYGLRLVGPNCLGVINADPAVSMNASLSPVMPTQGRIGFFCQSGGLGVAIVDNAAERGIGMSTFVSAGNRADVSGNDLLQYWTDDDATDIVLLYLESIGNPRRFSRIARQTGRRKPVVAVRSGGTSQGVPLGRAVRPASTPVKAVAALYRQAGVVGVGDLNEMFDVAGVLLDQPLPAGDRVAVVGNSAAVGLMAADAVTSAGLQLSHGPEALSPEVGPEPFEAALRRTLDLAHVDAVLAIVVHPLHRSAPEVAAAVQSAADGQRKPVVATAIGGPMDLPPGPRRMAANPVPSYPSVERAARALAGAAAYARWLSRPSSEIPDLADVDADAARDVVSRALAEAPAGRGLAADEVHRLLGGYGIPVGPAADTGAGVALRLVGFEDETFGPIVSLGVAGTPSELLGDVAYRVPPLSDLDAYQLVDELAAAPLLRGHGGAEPVDEAAVVDIVHRLARLTDDLPDVAEVTLDPVLATATGARVVSATAAVRPSGHSRKEPTVRRLAMPSG